MQNNKNDIKHFILIFTGKDWRTAPSSNNLKYFRITYQHRPFCASEWRQPDRGFRLWQRPERPGKTALLVPTLVIYIPWYVRIHCICFSYQAEINNKLDGSWKNGKKSIFDIFQCKKIWSAIVDLNVTDLSYFFQCSLKSQRYSSVFS